MARVCRELGLVSLAAGRAAEAEAEFRDAIEWTMAYREATTAWQLGQKAPTARQLGPGFFEAVEHLLRLTFETEGELCLRLAEIRLGLGDPAGSLGWLDQAVAVLAPLPRPGPPRGTGRRMLCLAHARRAHLLARAGRRADAAPDRLRAADLAGDLADDPKADPGSLYDLACVFSLASADAPDPDREEYAGRAIRLLARLRDAGYFARPTLVAHLDRDPDLDAVRGRDDFRRFRAALALAVAPPPQPVAR
jgi:hypothetical protein